MKNTRSMNVTMSPWVIKLPLADAELLAHLRLTGELRILTTSDAIWLKGESHAAPLAQQIRSIPNAEWFSIRDDGQLTRREETVPCDRLPTGDWMPIRDWFEVELPQAGFAFASFDKVPLKLHRSTAPQETNLLRTTWDCWYEYAIVAPQVRLSRLGFAVSETRDVLIRGTPLPPIRGQGYVETNGVIVPSGWQFSPNVGAGVIRQLLELDDEMQVIFSEDGSFERLPQSAFVQATRSSVRATHGA